MLSAVVGCAIRLALKDVLWVSAALGMSLALVVMMLTKTVHPPGVLLLSCDAFLVTVPHWRSSCVYGRRLLITRTFGAAQVAQQLS